MTECTESGCGEAGRWLVGDRRFCAGHGIEQSTRRSVAMRLVCPVVEIVVDESDVVGMAPTTISQDAVSLSRVSVWDDLQAALEAIPFHDPTEREQLLRDIAWAAIENGRGNG
jgi:hypothetical protein